MSRRVMALALTPLVILVIVLLSASSAAAKTLPPLTGNFVVPAGYAMHLTGMNLASVDTIQGAVVCSSCTPVYGIPLGRNTSFIGINDPLPDWSYTNTTSSTVTMSLALVDYSAGITYYSDGTAIDSGGNLLSVNHVTIFYLKKGVGVSINEGEAYKLVDWQPLPGFGHFNATVDITKN